MEDLIPTAEAAQRFGVNPRSLRARLQRDLDNGFDLHGSKKIGKMWFVSEKYMTEWKDRRKKE